ncbi:hypothetical protein [Shewanella salipaludis]|uniref:Lipoprotein n=1 Tax=Shewanella salipaludis TaxID=2723052 RepID=A0A972G4G9_9GAMM|nr:hypothetical protein [Shewanella salipaludis]NMH67064.1 hypothetical protein [Shewanella salipaludis]
MRHTRQLPLAALPLAFVMTLPLAGCGGSSSAASTPTPTPPAQSTQTQLQRCDSRASLQTVTTGSELSFQLEDHYLAGQAGAIMASIAGRDSQGLNYLWQQTAGPALSLTDSHGPLLALAPELDGAYGFRLTVTGAGVDVSEEVEIQVDAAAGTSLNVRQDQQVVEGNDVSLRLGRVDNAVAADIDWCVAAGPDLSVDLSNQERPLFKAPQVDRDTLSQLSVSATVAGNVLTENAYLLITQAPAIGSNYFDTPVARTHAYRADSAYAATLAPCVYSNQLSDPCPLAQLPLIGQQAEATDREAILDRLLVSHDWMGENFEAFLTQMDPDSDFAKLLQAVTAVVISSDIRPSFYWVATGAIYLDPEDLWLTAAQRDSINEAPDYRAGFGNELAFLMPWRYVKDNAYVSRFYDRSQRAARTLTALQPDLASLLYHELGHANDFFPRSIHAGLSGPTLVDDYRRRDATKALLSDSVSNLYPLNSAEMLALAEVNFLGADANATQKAYTPGDVSQFFRNDRANDFYAYSSSREDTAMLFEEAMMSHRYGILRDVAVTDKPAQITASSIRVDWGQRGRIGAPELADRAALVIDGILPELNGAAIIAALPEPLAMTQGRSWSDNLGISPMASQPKSQGVASRLSPDATPELRLSGDRHKPLNN